MTIETVTKFRTDDGQEFDSEAEAIAHEKKDTLQQLFYENPINFTNVGKNHKAKTVINYINTHRDAILEYLTGEDLPQPHPAPTFGYRDGDSIEPVHPILFRGEVIRQPEDAWNACRRYALEIVGKQGLRKSEVDRIACMISNELSRKLTLDQEINDAETSS